MKTLSPEEKAHILEARARGKRVSVAAEIARSEWKIKLIGRGIMLSLGVVMIALAIALWRGRITRQETERARYQAGTYSAFTNLMAMAEGVEAEHRAAMERIDFELLGNYALLEQSIDTARFQAEIHKARGVVAYSREEVKMLFREIYRLFPPDSVNERHDAQRVYGELMTIIDVSETRVDLEERKVKFLSQAKGQWRSQHGKITFDSASLEAEFQSLSQIPDASTARWQKDFGEDQTHGAH